MTGGRIYLDGKFVEEVVSAVSIYQESIDTSTVSGKRSRFFQPPEVTLTIAVEESDLTFDQANISVVLDERVEDILKAAGWRAPE